MYKRLAIFMSPNHHHPPKQYSPVLLVLFCTQSPQASDVIHMDLLDSRWATVLILMYCRLYGIFTPVLHIWDLRWSYSSLYTVLVGALPELSLLYRALIGPIWSLNLMETKTLGRFNINGQCKSVDSCLHHSLALVSL
jgi:hypothetical protein